MSELSARLALPYLLPAQAQKHVTHNEALETLDTLVQLVLEEVGAQTPPPAPLAGQVWALGAAPGGDWAGEAGRLARYADPGWRFVTPAPGWIATERGTGQLMVHDGSGWGPLPAAGLDDLDGVGIGTAHDPVNRLAVAAEAALFSHAGAGHQIKVNKAQAADTASLLFQTGWSGRAEMGTAGSDAFAIKVSADGAAWTTALSLDPATGHASGAAVQQGPADVTPGRLARADHAYGPGNLLGPVSQAAGLPTGAVIERGSTADGDYVRYADGTQICTQSGLVAPYINGNYCAVNWTFPAGFSTPPLGTTILLDGGMWSASGPASGISRGDVTAIRGNVSAAQMSAQAWVRSDLDFAAGDTVPLSVTAVGRWF